MEKFTKGVGVVKPEEAEIDYIRVRSSRLGELYKICNVIKPSYNGASEFDIQQARANAALIATAPEMYWMLAKLSGLLTDINAHSVVKEIETLLSKARGE